MSGSVSNLKKDVGNATIVVCKESRGSCSAVNKIKVATCDKVKSINVCCILRNNKLCAGILYADNSLKEVSLTILNVLTERVRKL